ncbi:MAG: hypothetical protein IKH11_06425 [Bacteroidales bacterium]|nr:hypothetical protein [Bacteroidales bacterium]
MKRKNYVDYLTPECKIIMLAQRIQLCVASEQNSRSFDALSSGPEWDSED